VAERYQLPDGRIAEKTPDGKYRIVSGGPALGSAIGNDPKLPGQLQGQQFSNQAAGVNARVNTATENAQIRKANAEASKAETEAQTSRVEGSNPGAKAEMDLRKEFHSLDEVKTYKEAAAAIAAIMSSPNTGGGDIQVIYNFIKAQGPGPVAQGELELAQGVASLREDLERRYGKITDSNRLPERVRIELIEAARQAANTKRLMYNQAYSHYRDLASQNNVVPERVTGPHLADSIRPVEERYIRAHGGNPRSELGSVNALRNAGGNPQFDPAGKGATVTYKPDQDANAFTDSAVRGGMTPGQFIDEYQRRFGNIDRPIGDVVTEYEAARKHFQENPNFKGSYGNATKGERLDPLGQAWNNALQTPEYTFAGRAANAMTGGIPTLLAGDEGRMQFGIMGQRDPNAALAGEITGAVGGTMLANRALSGGANLLKNAPGFRVPANFLSNNPGKAAVIADTGYGATYGATQNPDNPLAGAAMGAGAAVAGNAIGRGVIAPSLRAAGEGIARTPIGQAALGKLNINPAPALPGGQSLLMGQAERSGIDDVIAQMRGAQDLNMPFTLADADPRLRTLGGSVVRKSPDAFAHADNAIGSRPQGQQERALGLIDRHLAPSGDINAIKSAEIAAAREAAGPLYEQAYAQPARMSEELGSVLQTPAGRQALARARTIAANERRDPNAMGFDLDEAGETILAPNPSVQTLDYVKRGLDDILEQYRDPVTRQMNLDEAGRAVENVRQSFLREVDRMNPDFAAARSAYQQRASRATDADRGYKATSPRILPETVAGAVSSLPPENLSLYRQGFASSLADTVERGRLSSDPYEQIYGSLGQQQKMGTVFPQGAANFGRARGVEREMSATNKELFGGSPTQPRAEADKQFEGGFGDAAVDFVASTAAGAPPISAARSLLFAGRGGFGGLRDAWRLGVGNRAKEKADQIAPILFNPDPQATITTLEELMRQKAARDAYVSRTGMFGSSIGTPLAVSYGVGR
jgi:hypothetical protein